MTRFFLLLSLSLAPAFACAQCFKAVLTKGDQLFNQGKFSEARTTWELGKDCLDFDETVLKKRLWKIRDNDGDGKVNGNDTCPDVFAKTANGCPKPKPKDTDQDGVPDNIDRCEDEYGLKKFEGCPDSDGDAVPDIDDNCPTTPGSKAHKGCPPPKDSDGDGVPDSKDDCDNAYAVTSDGCPDVDGDGVADKDDKCPSEKGQTRFEGCPDTDGDNVPVHLDKCKNEKGLTSNNGCPEPTSVRCQYCPEMVLVKGGTFQMGSDDLDSQDDEKPVHSVTVGDFIWENSK